MILSYFLITTIVFGGLCLLLRSRKLNFVIAVLYSVIHIGLSCYSYKHIGNFDSVYFKFDSISVLFNALLSILLIPTLYHSKLYFRRYIDNPKKESYYTASMIALFSAISIIYFSEHIVVLWIGIEITTLLVAFLIYHERYQDSLEASWKYLFVSSVGIAIAFMGILLIAAQISKQEEASLSIQYLMSVAADMNSPLLKAAFLLMLTGYSIKLNTFPLFAATIDAKTVAPAPVNAVISTVLVNAGFIAIFRIFSIITVSSSLAWAQNVFLITGLISLLLAAIQMFRVKRFKRMFAFSSMEHVALVFIALSVGKVGYYAAILHLVFHTLIKSGLFYQYSQIRAVYKSGWIANTGNYMKLNPLGALACIVGLISITAIPPSGLFVSEFLIFKALFSQSYIVVAVCALILLTLIIYIFFKNGLKLLYSNQPENLNPQDVIINNYETISQFVLFGIVIYLGFNPPAFFIDLIQSAIHILN